jgi:hypothetical protein
MEKQYEAPELTLVGKADEVVLGVCGGGDDYIGQVAADFEFEQD